MYLLASCNECQAPQGMFTNINDLKHDICKQRVCWNCENNFVSPISHKLINLYCDEFQDSETLINKSLDFWSDDWEEKYINWLDKKGIEITDKTKNQYDSVRDAIKKQFENSNFWNELMGKLGDFQYDYKSKNKSYDLLLKLEPPKIKEKSFDSFF